MGDCNRIRHALIAIAMRYNGEANNDAFDARDKIVAEARLLNPKFVAFIAATRRGQLYCVLWHLHQVWGDLLIHSCIEAELKITDAQRAYSRLTAFYWHFYADEEFFMEQYDEYRAWEVEVTHEEIGPPPEVEDEVRVLLFWWEGDRQDTLAFLEIIERDMNREDDDTALK